MAKLGEYGDRLETMTAQEVFDVGAKHLLEQNEKSQNTMSVCMYMGNDGLCCAAAPFIKEYDPTLEENDWNHVVDVGAASSNHYELIKELQTIHDMYPSYNWKEVLEVLAKESNLNPGVLD